MTDTAQRLRGARLAVIRREWIPALRAVAAAGDAGTPGRHLYRKVADALTRRDMIHHDEGADRYHITDAGTDYLADLDRPDPADHRPTGTVNAASLHHLIGWDVQTPEGWQTITRVQDGDEGARVLTPQRRYSWSRAWRFAGTAVTIRPPHYAVELTCGHLGVPDAETPGRAFCWLGCYRPRAVLVAFAAGQRVEVVPGPNGECRGGTGQAGTVLRPVTHPQPRGWYEVRLDTGEILPIHGRRLALCADQTIATAATPFPVIFEVALPQPAGRWVSVAANLAAADSYQREHLEQLAATIAIRWVSRGTTPVRVHVQPAQDPASRVTAQMHPAH